MAVIGWLMFGDDVSDEITANVLLTTSYPQALSICIVIFIAIIPITKVPLKYVSTHVLVKITNR
jgi:vesicular inhibitory amino acid transporter